MVVFLAIWRMETSVLGILGSLVAMIAEQSLVPRSKLSKYTVFEMKVARSSVSHSLFSIFDPFGVYFLTSFREPTSLSFISQPVRLGWFMDQATIQRIL